MVVSSTSWLKRIGTLLEPLISGDKINITSLDNSGAADRDVITNNGGTVSWKASPSASERRLNSFNMGSDVYNRMSEPSLLVLMNDDHSTTVCEDHSSAGHSGAFYNMDVSNRIDAGMVYALNLNGTDEYVNFTDNNDFTFSEMTTGAIIDVTTGLVSKQCIITKFHEDGITKHREYEFFIDTNDKLIFRLWDESSAVYIQTQSNAVITSGYHFISGTYDGKKNASGINLYVDGLLVTSTDTDDVHYVAMEQETSDVRIGALYSGVLKHFFNGKIGTVFLDGVEWSAADIWGVWLDFRGNYNI